MPSKINGSCKICDLKDAKYRCPKCEIVYCSLDCYKTHKSSEKCSSKDKTTSVTTPIIDIQTDAQSLPENQLIDDKDNADRVPLHTLQNIENSEHVKNLLCNKHLRDMLTEINSSANPSKSLQDAMQIPIFTEFVDNCLQIVEPPAPPAVQVIDTMDT